MIFIEKQPTIEAKKALSSFIKQEGDKAHFSNFKQSDGKGDVQKSLLAEQFHLCAYCMRRIHETEKIEHWHTQESSKEESNPHETLDYDNMLAVCKGVSIHKVGEYEHCDQSRSKSNKELTIKPTVKQTVDKIKYQRNGKIYSTDPEIDDDLNNPKVLNLNNLTLQDNRKNVYESVRKLKELVYKRQSESLAEKAFKKVIEGWKQPTYNSEVNRHELREFCGIVWYFYDK